MSQFLDLGTGFFQSVSVDCTYMKGLCSTLTHSCDLMAHDFGPKVRVLFDYVDVDGDGSLNLSVPWAMEMAVSPHRRSEERMSPMYQFQLHTIFQGLLLFNFQGVDTVGG